MAEAAKLDYLSLTDYLQGENDRDARYEYVDGQVYAMAGGSAI